MDRERKTKQDALISGPIGIGMAAESPENHLGSIVQQKNPPSVVQTKETNKVQLDNMELAKDTHLFLSSTDSLGLKQQIVKEPLTGISTYCGHHSDPKAMTVSPDKVCINANPELATHQPTVDSSSFEIKTKEVLHTRTPSPTLSQKPRPGVTHLRPTPPFKRLLPYEERINALLIPSGIPTSFSCTAVALSVNHGEPLSHTLSIPSPEPIPSGQPSGRVDIAHPLGDKIHDPPAPPFKP